MLSRILVVSQVAVSLLLLIGAGLFVRSLQKLNAVDTGFTRESVLLLRLEPRGSDQKHANSQRLMAIYGDLLDRVESIPGVRSASLAGFSPLHHSGFGGPVTVPGFTPRSEDEMNIRGTPVYPKYFATLGIPILLGRDFGQADTTAQAAKVAVINETMAKRFFPSGNPVGRQFLMGRTAFEVIGVVKDAKYNSLREPTPAMAYMPYLQTPTGRGQMTLHVRAMGDANGIAAQVRREALAIDKDMPVFEVKTVTEEVDASIAQERLVARLSSFFGMLALLLASIGLYGVLAYAAARRTGEIGIRMALGAQPRDVVWMVMREVLLLIAVGLSIGLSIAAAATRLVASMLFGLTPTDPLTIAIATSLMVAVALLAGYLPARNASRIDPMLALRHE